MILYQDVSMIILRVTEAIRGPYNTTVYADDYLKVVSKGYWYKMEINNGMLKRMKYARQVEKLEHMLAEEE